MDGNLGHGSAAAPAALLLLLDLLRRLLSDLLLGQLDHRVVLVRLDQVGILLLRMKKKWQALEISPQKFR